ncbi:hypothetical protein PRUPE_5G108900 [Prunus persica]|uniref:Late embryogenesis abundant protein LEA-2 subgroup domain-containing protein n=1 Tax=Prunus persica TaxID=3760 RepID=M5WAN8_PRUPE|nr:hypothetical protein PRUPE_5G108900 [Prunus persica]
MADKTNQTYPSGSANTGYTRSDGESQLSSHELKRKKRIKLAIYIAIFVVFQTIVITIMSLTVLKVKTPKFRLGNISVESDEATSLKFKTQIKIKNSANWGSYKFKASNVTFQHQGKIVGVLDIEKGKVGWLSTIKRDAEVSLNLDAINGSNLGSEVMLNSVGRLEGKVAIMFIMKKKKATNMNCTIAFHVNEQSVSPVHCK